MQHTSWLQQWWNESYLQVREPTLAHGLLADDPSTQGIGIARAAAILRATTLFSQKVSSGDLPHDAFGKQKIPLWSVSYKYLFRACRIPQPIQDCYRLYDPSVSRHAAVACWNQFFAVPLFDKDGRILPLAVMKKNLLECQGRAQDMPPRLELGWLTTSRNRDDWANGRTELLHIGGPSMKRALELVESSMVLVCLDDEEPASDRHLSEQCWHGCGLRSGGNRWNDKSLQLVVTKMEDRE